MLDRAVQADFGISIHPPRVGRDDQQGQSVAVPENFNPPSPCGEGQTTCASCGLSATFQSTLPVWGGTGLTRWKPHGRQNFNPPSPCGEGPTIPVSNLIVTDFNPPSPCGEGRRVCGSRAQLCADFNPPSPVGTDDFVPHLHTVNEFISIHPPRVGRDVIPVSDSVSEWISIHPPRVGRDGDAGPHPRPIPEFQSTLPVWGGTRPFPRRCHRQRHFNPPSPCGEGPVNS